MRRSRWWVGVVATAFVALSGTVAQAAPVGWATSADAVRSAPAARAAAAAVVTDVPGAMHVLPVRRVLDTRSGLGAPAGLRVGGTTTTVTVTGHGGVPASGVAAVVLHVTAAVPTGSGYVTTYPGGTTPPTASTLNVTPGQGITNMTVVPVGAAGTVSLRYTGSGTVHLVADVAGWTATGDPVDPGATGTSAPARLMDTRTGLGGTTGRIAAGGLATLQVTGRGGVPATVGSVTLNVTVVAPTRTGWLAVTPVDPGAGLVRTSSVNVVTGQTIANAVTSAVSPAGTVDLRLSATTSADVVVDVLSWTVAGTPTMPGGLLANAPVRLLDTRTGTWAPPVPAGGVTSVDAGFGAAVLNVTAVGAARAGHVVISADGAGTPLASQLTVPVSTARAAQVVVPAAWNGRVRLTVSSASSLHLVVDRVAAINQPGLDTSLPGAPATLTAAPQGAGVALSWTGVPDAAGYVVRRLAARAPASPYQGHQVWSGGATPTAFSDGTAAPGVDYTYAVYARDAGGNLSEATLATATTPALSWTAPTRISPYAGRPADVSCPTTTWCLAVGQFGESWVWSGGAWTASGRVAADPVNPYSIDFVAVSCPTTTFCLAVVNGRGLATWRAGTWTLTPTASLYTDVSCWSATACGLLVGEGVSTAGPELERWTSGTIGGAVAIPGRAGGSSLSCPTSVCSFLTRANGSVYVHRVSGTTATTKSLGAGYQAELSCVSSTWCMTVVEGRYRTGYGTTWSAARDAATIQNFSLFVTMDLSCASTTSCTLVGVGGAAPSDANALRWNGSSWSIAGLGAGLNTQRAVDCAAVSQCMVVDERGRFTRWTGSAWTARTTFANARGGFSSLDCVSATSCLATDDYGNALSWAGGATWPRVSISEGRSYADCTGSTCMTVDVGEMTWRVRRSGTWGPMTRNVITPFTAPMCATSTRCFALDSNSYLQWTGAGDWGPDYRALPVNLGSPPGGDCPTTTFCLAVAPGGLAVQWNGTRWVSRGRAPLPAGLDVTVDCVSAAFCMASADTASAVLTASGWRAVPPATFGSTGLACRSTTLCLAVANGSIVAWDGAEWAMTSMAIGDPVASGLIDCVGTARCVVVAGDKAWWTT